MILNRQTLRTHIEDEDIILKIARLAVKYNISFEQMGQTKRGVYPMTHFKLDDWITAHKNKMKELRVDYVQSNQELLDVILKIKD